MGWSVMTTNRLFSCLLIEAVMIISCIFLGDHSLAGQLTQIVVAAIADILVSPTILRPVPWHGIHIQMVVAAILSTRH